jgi:MoxR-like ATPase
VSSDGSATRRPRQQEKWWLFRGTGEPADAAELHDRWPPAPSWRDFDGGPDLPPPPDDHNETERRLGAAPAGLFNPAQISVINSAIYLRRPLLITGAPGSGKSSLAYMIAKELGLGRVLRWPITSRTSLRSGLYEYDAMGRAQATLQLRNSEPAGRRYYAWPRSDEGAETERAKRGGASLSIGEFVHLGPLGTALLPHRVPRVLLIDEMDKSDFDLPNDLLNVFEEGEFDIPELIRVRASHSEVEVHTADRGRTAVVHGGLVRCHAFPIVIITSNEEREFPAAFLRRCVRLDLPAPSVDGLAALVAAHFPRDSSAYHALVTQFVSRRDTGAILAADQLLNAVHLGSVGALPQSSRARTELLDSVWRRLDPDVEP